MKYFVHLTLGMVHYDAFMVVVPNDWSFDLILSKVLSSGVIMIAKAFGEMIITEFNNILEVALCILTIVFKTGRFELETGQTGRFISQLGQTSRKTRFNPPLCPKST